MKNVVSAALVLGALSNLNACGKKEEASKEAGLFSRFGSSSSESKTPAAGSSSDSVTFNLSQYLSSRSNALQQYAETGVLGLGDKKMFRIENNFTVSAKSSDRKISSQYYIDAYAMGAKLSSSGSYAVDITANATLDEIAANVSIRSLGQDLYKNKITTKYDQSFMRDLGVSAPVFTAPGLGMKVGAKVGGEIGLKATPSIGQNDSSVAVNVAPRAALTAELSGGITALLFANAKAQGSVVLIDAEQSTYSEIGEGSTNAMYGMVKINPFTVDALSGKIELLASLGLGNVFPDGVSNRIWNKALSSVGAQKSYDYSYTVWETKGINAATIPGTTMNFGEM